MTVESGTPFGRYRLERLIGSGGMGDVYEATDLERERVVALKLLPELFSANAEFTERFRRESRIAARLRDPHIIPIHDYGEIDRRLYIDMRLVDNGVTIANLLRDEGPMAPGRAVAIVEQIAEALDSAHDDGLVHRDVKPSNVLVTYRDFVYVVDFGIAHVMGQTAYGLTGTHSTVGTLDYMAPERFEERGADRRSDVYSLACLLHECLTARTPFRATTAPGLMYAHLHLDPPAPSEENAAVPAALDEVVRVGMAKEPDDRFPTAGELGRAARLAVDEERPAARPRLGPVDDPAARVRTQAAPTATEPSPEPGPASAAGPRGTEVATLADDAGGTTERPPDAPAAVDEPAPDAGAPTTPEEKTSEKTSPATVATTVPVATTTPTAVGPAPTTARPTDQPTGPTGRATTALDEPTPAPDGQPPPQRRFLVLGVVAAALVAVVVLVVALVPSASDPPAPTVSATIAPPIAAARSLPDPRVIGSVTTPPEPGFVTVDPTGRSAYVTQRGPRLLTVLDLTTRRPRAEIAMPSIPRFVTVSADGARAFVSCYDDGDANSKVAFVDLRTNQVTRTVDVDLQPYAVALAPDQRTLWVPSHRTASVDVVDTVTGAVTARRPVAPNPHWIVFAGSRAYAVNHESNLVTVMDTATATPGKTIPVGRSPHAAALSPDGRRLAVVNFEGDDVTMIDTATDTVTGSIPVGAGPQHVVWAADGRHLYTADVDAGTVSVVDTTTGQRTASVPVGPSPTSLALYQGGASAVVSVLDGAQLAVLATGD